MQIKYFKFKASAFSIALVPIIIFSLAGCSGASRSEKPSDSGLDEIPLRGGSSEVVHISKDSQAPKSQP